MALLRLLTRKAVMEAEGLRALSNRQAWEVYGGLLADVRIGFEHEPTGLDEIWRRLSSLPSESPNVWMDAYLAAFAKAGGHTLVTFDRAFLQFEGVEVEILG